MTASKPSTPKQPVKNAPDQQNGIEVREPATVELVQRLSKRAGGPVLSQRHATAIAGAINQALRLLKHWQDEYVTALNDSLSFQRNRRIADAIATLQLELPASLEDLRRDRPDLDLSTVEDLLVLARKNQFIVDNYPHRIRGRPTSLEKSLAVGMSKKIQEIWGTGTPKTAADAFAAMAIDWLTGRSVPQSDQAITRARSRRTKMP